MPQIFRIYHDQRPYLYNLKGILKHFHPLGLLFFMLQRQNRKSAELKHVIEHVG